MPGENKEKLTQTTSGGRREASSPSKAGDPDRSPRGSSMIPLPRALQQNPKTVKTEKNRLRLIMENRGLTDVLEKERRIRAEDRGGEGYRLTSRGELAPRYRGDMSCNLAYRCPARKVTPSCF